MATEDFAKTSVELAQTRGTLKKFRKLIHTGKRQILRLSKVSEGEEEEEEEPGGVSCLSCSSCFWLFLVWHALTEIERERKGGRNRDDQACVLHVAHLTPFAAVLIANSRLPLPGCFPPSARCPGAWDRQIHARAGGGHRA